jgi:hypothetical protein
MRYCFCGNANSSITDFQRGLATTGGKSDGYAAARGLATVRGVRKDGLPQAEGPGKGGNCATRTDRHLRRTDPGRTGARPQVLAFPEHRPRNRTLLVELWGWPGGLDQRGLRRIFLRHRRAGSLLERGVPHDHGRHRQQSRELPADAPSLSTVPPMEQTSFVVRYYKGASMLDALQQTMGDEKFFLAATQLTRSTGSMESGVIATIAETAAYQ